MSDTKTWKMALKNAHMALGQLESFVQRCHADNDMERAAVIQAFEFTFEAFWKVLQKRAEAEGVRAPSPKTALTFGFQAGVCRAEQVWLNMLRDRNLTVHTYNAPLADRIYADVRDAYAAALREGLEELARTA